MKDCLSARAAFGGTGTLSTEKGPKPCLEVFPHEVVDEKIEEGTNDEDELSAEMEHVRSGVTAIMLPEYNVGDDGGQEGDHIDQFDHHGAHSSFPVFLHSSFMFVQFRLTFADVRCLRSSSQFLTGLSDCVGKINPKRDSHQERNTPNDQGVQWNLHLFRSRGH